MTATIETRHPFKVTLHADDSDEQFAIRVNAWGPEDVGNQMRLDYPDYSVLSVEQEPEEGLFA